MSELLYKEEIFQLVGLCMEIHRELGKGHDEVIYKDALVIELSRTGIPFSREKNYEIREETRNTRIVAKASRAWGD